MKKTLLFTAVLSLILQVSSAQETPSKFYVGVNILRCAPATSDYYYFEAPNEPSLINGFFLGYQQNHWLGYFIEFRKISSHINEPGIDWFDKYNTKGVEISVGPTLSTTELKRFTITFSAGVFAELTKVNGYIDKGDFTGIYEVNHTKNFYGVSPGLEVNFRVSDRASIFAKSRYRAGKVYYTGHGSNSPFQALSLEDLTYNCFQFDPLSGLGVRFSF